MSRSVSLSSAISRVVLWTSTTGVSPVTVTVSCTPPTRISASTAMTAEPLTISAVALDRGEAGQRERHAVGARPQILDAISSGAVGRRWFGLSRSAPGWRLPPSRQAARRRMHLSRDRRWSLAPRPLTARRAGTPARSTYVRTHASVNSPLGCSRAQVAPADST